MFCPRCGMVQADGASFCTFCGLPFSEFKSDAERAVSETQIVPIQSRIKLGPGGHWYLDGVPIDPNAGISSLSPRTVPLLGVERDTDFDEKNDQRSKTLSFLERKTAIENGASYGVEPPISFGENLAAPRKDSREDQYLEQESDDLFPDEPLDREDVVPYHIVRLVAGVLAIAGALVQILFCVKLQTFRMLLRFTLDGIQGLPQLIIALILLIGGSTGILSRRSEPAAIFASVCYLAVAIIAFFLSESDGYMLWYLAAYGAASVCNLLFLIKNYILGDDYYGKSQT